MTVNPHPSIPLALRVEIDALCLQFESEWQKAEEPRIEGFLDCVVAAGRTTALSELIALEVDLQRNAGQPVSEQDYHLQFPNDADAVKAGFALLEERNNRHDQESPRTNHDDSPNDHVSTLPGIPGAGVGVPQRINRFVIRRVLGEGQFGAVYLADDPVLEQRVALKVPRDEHIAPGQVDEFIREARTAAQLREHPGIVTVYDVGCDANQVYIVQEYVPGEDLAKYLAGRTLGPRQVVELMIAITDAVAFAHENDFVHRDLKPQNILLDEHDCPRVADFGLALHTSQQRFHKGDVAGSPAYMSPEQVRGETHRLDGRSDIWGLGVIMYEMLAGRRPFVADTIEELFDQIIEGDPNEICPAHPTVPEELQRICLKCLARRVTDRYVSTAAMSADLRQWLSELEAPAGSDSEDKLPAKIVPRGLRCFEAADADFYLNLLPGPRDRDGLPESVGFWKTRIEETDNDRTFAVGLIYGPSGCGKSSLVNAGLLPRLAPHVNTVYVEATPADTEVRILKGIRAQTPNVPESVSLPRLLQGIREQTWSRARRKTLIVLDQFEQWLYANRGERDSQLLQALRHCDGGHLQCVLLVRDDFWLATSRFMRELEVNLIDGENQALVDLFDPLHARKVLSEFGRAFGRLPDNLDELTKEQNLFLDGAVESLARDGKVINVRLALFAEMVKGKPWNGATLKDFGGKRLGWTFLDETFTAETAPQSYQHHKKAAQNVLNQLLPDAGTNIKGARRSVDDLLRASGYGNRISDFDDLVRILNTDLRLITPTDPDEGDQSPTQLQAAISSRYFQLTHDYLVPALREWLTLEQRKTRRGRARLLLKERAALWDQRPLDRHLPSLAEDVRVRLLTPADNWSDAERKMMRRGAIVHTGRVTVSTLLLLALVVLVSTVRARFIERQNEQIAAERVETLLSAEIRQVPERIDELFDYRPWADVLLWQAYDSDEVSPDDDERLRASLALLPIDPDQVEYLRQRLMTATEAEVDQVLVIRDALRPYKDQILRELWKGVEQRTVEEWRSDTGFLPIASALADYEAGSQRWEAVAGSVSETLVSVNAAQFGEWMRSLLPVRARLLAPLTEILLNDDRTDQHRLAIDSLRVYASDRPDVIADLLIRGRPEFFSDFLPVAKEHPDVVVGILQQELDRKLEPGQNKSQLAKRQANAAAALAHLGKAGEIWPTLAHVPDPELRSWLVHRLGATKVDSSLLIKRLDRETETSIRRALILSLGEYPVDRVGDSGVLITTLLTAYRNDPDPGIHAACEWTLRRWDQSAAIQQIDKDPTLATGEVVGDRRWYITSEGHTMAVFEGTKRFLMGSPESEEGHRETERLHTEHIDHSFAIATKEVTVEQFREFLKYVDTNFSYPPEVSPVDRSPQISVHWVLAAMYCSWLSQTKERLPLEQSCYFEPWDNQIKVKNDLAEREGYRLPTAAEWEYACRAGAVTSRYYGDSVELLDKYARTIQSSRNQTLPVGTLKPNDFGLFDMLGNAWEWCHDGGVLSSDETVIRRVLRGSSYYNSAVDARSASRNIAAQDTRTNSYGFRIARTILPPTPPTELDESESQEGPRKASID